MSKIPVALRGVDLLHQPLLNKGTAFSGKERKHFGLNGLLPYHVSTIEEQCQRMFKSITRKDDPLEQHIGLSALQNRNETLYYRLLLENIEHFLPIVYTPVVGQACQRYSHIFRNTRGIWITPNDKGEIDKVLANVPNQDIRLIVVTDNERILGLGDQGAGGMGIPVGKLALYSVAAGIHPALTLPISLDVGTDNQELLDDPLYLGWREKRLRGKEYEELVEEFVEAVKHRFPKALLQWEDFLKQNAFDLLDRYRKRLLSFNDDIQGTAAIAVAGIFAACRATQTKLGDHRILILGGGAAGIGIGRLLRSYLKREGLEGKEVTQAVAVSDSQGLLVKSRTYREESKKDFAWPDELADELGIPKEARSNFAALSKAYKPTILLGTTGQPGIFSEDIIREMAKHVDRPVILPFSNPNSKCEAQPNDLIE